MCKGGNQTPLPTMPLTLSWWRPSSYRNQYIDLLRKLMDWFLYDNGLRHERVNVPAILFNHTNNFCFLLMHVHWKFSVNRVLRHILSVVKLFHPSGVNQVTKPNNTENIPRSCPARFYYKFIFRLIFCSDDIGSLQSMRKQTKRGAILGL